MGADNLILVLAEHQIADLGIGLHAGHLLSVNRVPESDASISGTAATCEQAFLMGRPRKCLDSGLVTRKAPHGFACGLGARVPHEKFIIVAARS